MNCRWEREYELLSRLRPFRLLEATTLWIHLPRSSTVIMNRCEERGSPCMMPQEGMKGGGGEPLTNIEKKHVDETIFLTSPT
jgi:hypothetical protein